MWVDCPQCGTKGEIPIGKPGDMFRVDYCPRCNGSGAVKETPMDLMAVFSAVAEGLQKLENAIREHAVPAFNRFCQKLPTDGIDLVRNKNTNDPGTPNAVFGTALSSAGKQQPIKVRIDPPQ